MHAHCGRAGLDSERCTHSVALCCSLPLLLRGLLLPPPSLLNIASGNIRRFPRDSVHAFHRPVGFCCCLLLPLLPPLLGLIRIRFAHSTGPRGRFFKTKLANMCSLLGQIIVQLCAQHCCAWFPHHCNIYIYIYIYTYIY